MTILRKTLALAIAASFLATNADAQTLFTYGTNSVTKEEFIKAFNKNNAGTKATPEAYREYLDLYTKFRVKVKAARDMKLDTISSQLTELQGFKAQVAENFINDDNTINALVTEAFERGKKEIHLAHIFIPFDADGNETSQKNAAVRIQGAYSQLDKGVPFETVALAESGDAAVKQNKGDVGYITVFSLSYELENLVYSTPVNGCSQPFKSKTGYHIVKNLGERPSSGRLRAAQILIAVRDEYTTAQKSEAKKLADSLYTVVAAGGDFKTLAAKFSSDNLSYQTGGEMMEFGVGSYDPAFENVAFGLSKDGEVARPVLTSFGYHIIKRLERKPTIASLEDGREKDALKQQVYQSDRMEYARKKQLVKVRELVGYKKAVYQDAALWRATDSVLKNVPIPVNPAFYSKTVLFSIGDEKIQFKDWQDHLLQVRNTRTHMSKQAIFAEFTDTKTLDYYKQHLEKYNKDFAFQVNEFRDGNLLFEIMQRKIWDKESNDSIGLKKYYEQYKAKYKWEQSADAIVFTFIDIQTANEYRSRIDSNWRAWNKLAETSDGRMQADSARFELSQIP
ncbi:MAG: hypothetical protein EOO01_11325, partial [Chitinophagaceae bacterium]